MKLGGKDILNYAKFLQQLNQFVKRNPDIKNKTQVADALHVSRHQVRRGLKKLGLILEPESKPCQQPNQREESVEFDDMGASARLVTVSKRIKTLEDALEKGKINLNVWEVDRVVINSWEVGSKGPGGAYVRIDPLWQIKVWLKRKQINIQSISDKFIELVQSHAPKYTNVKAKYNKDFLKNAAEIDIPDVHLGKLCWGEETGTDYNHKIAEKAYLYSVNESLFRIEPYKPELIIFPVGNDYLNVDNLQNETTAGTKQDLDSRQTKIFELALDVLVRAVDNIMHYYPKIIIPVIPGNHDKLSMFHLGVALKAWYRSAKNIIVDNSPKSRKYVQYGKNLIGFLHGGKEDPKINDLPLIMAQERPKEWAETTNREWHIGHLHKKKETKYIAGDTYKGVSVRIVPSLSGTDAWHYEKGFIQSSLASETFVWDHERGLVSQHLIRVPPEFYDD